MEIITIKSTDGIMLEAAIHRVQQDTPRGCIILAHGITASMDEGILLHLAEKLTKTRFTVLRFSYRGHGKSGGTQRGMTIAGEMLDLQAVIDFTLQAFNLPIAIIAISFGAVSTCLSIPFIKHHIQGIAFWNPVLDLQRTFIHPEVPWGKKYFNNENVSKLISDGFILLNGTFEFGRVLWEEMKWLDPSRYFLESSIPTMIVHGDCDSCVPYSISRDAALQNRYCDLFTIEGSDHGFSGKETEDKVIDITINWLIELSTRDKPHKSLPTVFN
ncbi:MAG: alpha/beta hydrolase [bacterium]|nr:alpha/beta hydrolase [bacterium]